MKVFVWSEEVKNLVRIMHDQLVQKLNRGVSRIFERGGGPISFGSLKKGHQILKGGGVEWSEGGVQYISLTRTTNLAYLDAKE